MAAPQRGAPSNDFVPLVGHHKVCLRCGISASARFTLRLDLDGTGTLTDIARAFACATHQVDVQQMLVDWAEERDIIHRL